MKSVSNNEHPMNSEYSQSEVSGGMKSQKKQIQYDQRIKNLTNNQVYQILPKRSLKKVQSMDDKFIQTNQNQFKKIQNRESAKISRQKKKIYYQLLEQTSTQLKKQIYDLQSQIKSQSANQDESSEVLFLLKLNKFLIDEKNLLKILEKNQDDASNKQILIDSYKQIFKCQFRFGTSGKQRKQLIQQLNQEIIQLMAPQHMLYFFYCAQNNFDIFSEETNFLKQEYNIDQQQIEHIKTVKEIVKKQGEQFDSLMVQYMNNQIKILSQTQQLDQMIEEQMGNQDFLKYIDIIQQDPQKFQDIYKTFWNTDDQIEPLSTSSKKIKLDQSTNNAL